MSEHITHIAVCEDVTRLMNVMQSVVPAFKQSVSHYPDECLMGSAARGNHLFALPIIEKYRDHWGTSAWKQEDEIATAFAVGWLCHRAADLQMKPLFKYIKESEAPKFTSKQNRVYHDAITFHEVYADGKTPTMSERALISPATLEQDMHSHPAAHAVNEPFLEGLVNGLIQRSLLDQQTFYKEEKDITKWVNEFMTHQQRTQDDLQWYIDAYQQPEAEKTKRYIDAVDYYNKNDALIKLARSAQHGEKITEAEVLAALKTAPKESQYAQALAKGCGYLVYASEFFRKEIDMDKALDLTEISSGGGE